MDKFKDRVDFSKKQLMAGTFMYFGAGFSNSEKNFGAGVDAAREAASLLQDNEYSLAIGIVTPDYDYRKVYDGIRSVVGDVPVAILVNNFAAAHSAGSESGVAVGIFSRKVGARVEIAKGFSLGSKRAIHEAVGKLIESSSNREYNYLVFFAPNSIPLAGENTYNALVEFADSFDGIIGGIVGDPEKMEYQTFLLNGKTYTDHAIFIKLESDVRFYVDQAHGFHPVRPFKITGIRGDMIISLDDDPAFYILLDVLSRKGYSEEDIRDPVKASRILNRFQFAVADKNKPGIFRAVLPMNISERGIRLNAFLSEGDSIWLMESSTEEMHEAVDKMMGRAMGRLDKINGALMFESFVRRRVLSLEDYVEEQRRIGDNLKAPYLLVETVEEVVIAENLYPGAHMGSIAGIFF